jgi:hypothetical protein
VAVEKRKETPKEQEGGRNRFQELKTLTVN